MAVGAPSQNPRIYTDIIEKRKILRTKGLPGTMVGSFAMPVAGHFLDLWIENDTRNCIQFW
jgi:hypothetical protein